MNTSPRAAELRRARARDAEREVGRVGDLRIVERMVNARPCGHIGDGFALSRALARAGRLNLDLTRPTAPMPDGRVLVFARDLADRQVLLSYLALEHDVTSDEGSLVIEVLP